MISFELKALPKGYNLHIEIGTEKENLHAELRWRKILIYVFETTKIMDNLYIARKSYSKDGQLADWYFVKLKNILKTKILVLKTINFY